MEKFEPTNWPPKPPKDSKYRHLGDIIDYMCPMKQVSVASDEEVQEMPLEKQMWRDMLADLPFPEGDPRDFFLNGHTSAKKEAMFQEWRRNWYEDHLAEGTKSKKSLEDKTRTERN